MLTESDPMCYCLPGWMGTRCNDVRKSVPNQEIYSRKKALNSRALVACPIGVNPCLNSGSCFIFNGNQLMCGCTEKFTGDLCEMESPCKPGGNNYCGGGSTCIPDPDPTKAPTCICASGSYGFNCMNIIVTVTTTTPQTTTMSAGCKLFPTLCQNGGTCESDGTTTTCKCPPTHAGPQCKTPVGATPSQGPPVVPGQTTPPPVPGQTTPPPVPGQTTPPPVPGQTTPPLVIGPSNKPPAGVTCAQNPCRNNRPCYNNGNSYFCSCGSQYRGINCEEFISG
ncbi:unnamed protein product [Rotaria magnacalcarata]|uniref:EGF-like domain-containing protein n=3 Tax=Rotaria magnacalcarata TaxID=392030 RepID=A0A816BM17_9BILA|nr:unnamed protein product [Rotaria magnacalcarata]